MQKQTPIRDFIRGVGAAAGSVSDSSNVEIIGKKRVVVEEVKKIVEYREDTVLMVAGKYTVSVEGGRLVLNNYGDKTLVIDGDIDSVRLS